MLGLAEREAAECRRCGGDLAETLDYGWTWRPQAPLVCLRCAALQASERSAEKHPHAAAMIHRVEKARRPQRKRKRRR